jgi:replicative DNA helicase
VPKRALSPNTAVLFDMLAMYWRQVPDGATVNPAAFALIFEQRNKHLPEETRALLLSILNRAWSEPLDEGLENHLLRGLAQQALACDLAAKLAGFEQGEEVDLRMIVDEITSEYDEYLIRKDAHPQVLDAIEDMLKDQENDVGFHFHLPSLNASLKPLVPGDFMVVAARPDRGKTSWLAHMLTHMAPQIASVYGAERRSILWLNNEGPGKRIVYRLFQAALKATDEDLVALANQPASPEFAHYKTKVREQYAAALGGRPGAIKVFDIHDYGITDVEDLIRKNNPALIVADMIDNVRWEGDAANGGTRTDQLLESLYQRHRVFGVKYGCPVIATSQLSGDAEGVLYPTQAQLKDSKTGKQGAADIIMTLGASNDPSLENSRFVGTPKNKKRRTGAPSSLQREVLFNGACCHFYEATQ